MSDFDYCPEWPEEIKVLYRSRYRAVCRMKNLEAYIERVTPREFDAVMDELENAREEVQTISMQFRKASKDYYMARFKV